MAYIMGLEGPKVRLLDRARGELYLAAPRAFHRFGVGLPGGKAAGMRPMQFERRALTIGTRVEMEHTNDPRIAQEIAMDHLVEDPLYYEKLRAVHLDGVRPYYAGLGAALFALGGMVFGMWIADNTRHQRR